ncbi:MAG: hypothetical protein K0S91_929 [Nitrososphaeraceae archaeon]|nr:hypothetical protein [Nitrososphaeraceae archaeon]
MSLFTLLLFPANILEFDNDVWATAGEATIPTYMITTRDGSDRPRGVQEFDYNGRPLGNINQLKTDCPAEVAIFVHGWHNDQYEAKERLDRVRMSLEHNNYIIPLIGLSWNSDIQWDNAKLIAKQNGPKLAYFIVDYINTCKHQYDKNVDVRLIAHSLGARVILSTLDSLNKNTTWKNNGFKIASVHLMGAAIDNEEVSKNPFDVTGNSTVKSAYGKAIEEEVIRFYNLYNPEDDMLEPLPFYPPNSLYEIYPFFEEDSALGQAGRQHTTHDVDKVSTPPYYDINVQNQIEAGQDADGIEDVHLVFCGLVICDETIIEDWDFGLCLAYYYFGILNEDCRVGIGDNHGGYIGFRNNIANRNVREYDGAMDEVVQHWFLPPQ